MFFVDVAAQLAAADLLIESPLVACLGYEVCFLLLGTPSNPQAAKLGAVSFQNILMENYMYHELPNGLKIRNSKPSDHPRIINVLKDWWGGRDLTWMLPKLFLIHFNNTSFVIEKRDELIAFLIGFLSPAKPKEGYIHFAGVRPDYRGIGIGELLYNRFFKICKENSRDTIRACTSPVNKGSIEFHKKIGFEISKGNAEIEGTQVTLDYNKPNDPKVLFEIRV